MQQINQQIVATIIAVVTLLIVIGLIALFLAIYYTNNKKRLLKEKAQMRLTFEAELAKTQYEVQEQTMQTIGADLHDNIGQLLSLTSLTLNSIEVENPKKAKEKVNAAIDLTLQSIKEMRLLGKLLQGDQLVVLGLPEAIRYEIAWLEKSGKYKVTFIEDGEAPAENNADKDLIIFRVLQEMLNNVIKHADATRIQIKLAYLEGSLQLQVKDNGKGFDAEGLLANERGMGLHNIEKRAGIIDSNVSVASKPGKGANITMVVPYP